MYHGEGKTNYKELLFSESQYKKLKIIKRSGAYLGAELLTELIVNL